MAIAFGSSMTTGTSASGNITTASVTPTAGNITLFMFSANGNTGTPSVSGCNLTWTKQTLDTYTGTETYLYWGVGASPSAGAISVTGLNGTGGNVWVVHDFSGTDTTTPFKQTKYTTGSGTALSATLGSAITAGNAAVGMGVRGNGSNTYTAGTNFTISGQSAGNGRSIGGEYQLNKSDDAIIDMTISSSGSWNMFGLELAQSPSTAPNSNFFLVF